MQAGTSAPIDDIQNSCATVNFTMLALSFLPSALIEAPVLLARPFAFPLSHYHRTVVFSPDRWSTQRWLRRFDEGAAVKRTLIVNTGWPCISVPIPLARSSASLSVCLPICLPCRPPASSPLPPPGSAHRLRTNGQKQGPETSPASISFCTIQGFPSSCSHSCIAYKNFSFAFAPSFDACHLVYFLQRAFCCSIESAELPILHRRLVSLLSPELKA